MHSSIGARKRGKVAPDVMHDYFQKIEDRLTFGSWWFGHYHADAELPGRRRLIYENIVKLGEAASITT